MTALTARGQAEACLRRYLRLCDVPGPADAVPGELGELFTKDAVWSGGGAAYEEKFGRTEGRDAIVGMLSRYLPPNSHFTANIHLLHQGEFEAEGRGGRGSWLMQQVSEYADGSREVMVARLDIEFTLEGQGARIQRFRTERLFTAPLST